MILKLLSLTFFFALWEVRLCGGPLKRYNFVFFLLVFECLFCQSALYGTKHYLKLFGGTLGIRYNNLLRWSMRVKSALAGAEDGTHGANAAVHCVHSPATARQARRNSSRGQRSIHFRQRVLESIYGKTTATACVNNKTFTMSYSVQANIKHRAS